jgi:hypothetical protein
LDNCGSGVRREVGFKIKPSNPNTRINGCHSSLCCPKTKRHTQQPPSRIWSTRPIPLTHATTRTIMSSCPLPSWYRQTNLTEGVTEDSRVEGFVGWGWRRSTITLNVRRGSAIQQPQAVALLTELGLLGEPATQPDAPFPALDHGDGKAAPGEPFKVATDGMSSIPKLDFGDNRVPQV